MPSPAQTAANIYYYAIFMPGSPQFSKSLAYNFLRTSRLRKSAQTLTFQNGIALHNGDYEASNRMGESR